MKLAPWRGVYQGCLPRKNYQPYVTQINSAGGRPAKETVRHISLGDIQQDVGHPVTAHWAYVHMTKPIGRMSP